MLARAHDDGMTKFGLPSNKSCKIHLRATIKLNGLDSVSTTIQRFVGYALFYQSVIRTAFYFAKHKTTIQRFHEKVINTSITPGSK